MSLFRTVRSPPISRTVRGRPSGSPARSSAMPRPGLIVVHVVESPVVYGELGIPVRFAGGDQAHQDALRDRLRAAYVPDRPLEVNESLTEGSPTEAILRAAEELDCNLSEDGRRAGVGNEGETVAPQLGGSAHRLAGRLRPPLETVRRAGFWPSSIPRTRTHKGATRMKT